MDLFHILTDNGQCPREVTPETLEYAKLQGLDLINATKQPDLRERSGLQSIDAWAL